MLAAILREEFGSALVTEKLDDRVNLPSPEELKYRILFKVSYTDLYVYICLLSDQTTRIQDQACLRLYPLPSRLFILIRPQHD